MNGLVDLVKTPKRPSHRAILEIYSDSIAGFGNLLTLVCSLLYIGYSLALTRSVSLGIREKIVTKRHLEWPTTFNAVEF